MKTQHLTIALAAMMCTASVAGLAIRPSKTMAQQGLSISLDTTVPKTFGEWTEVDTQGAQVVNPQTQELLDKLYSQILTRTYVNKDGYRIMLSMASAAGCRRTGPRFATRRRASSSTRSRTGRWPPRTATSRFAAWARTWGSVTNRSPTG